MLQNSEIPKVFLNKFVSYKMVSKKDIYFTQFIELLLKIWYSNDVKTIGKNSVSCKRTTCHVLCYTSCDI